MRGAASWRLFTLRRRPGSRDLMDNAYHNEAYPLLSQNRTEVYSAAAGIYYFLFFRIIWYRLRASRI